MTMMSRPSVVAALRRGKPALFTMIEMIPDQKEVYERVFDGGDQLLYQLYVTVIRDRWGRRNGALIDGINKDKAGTWYKTE